MAEKTSKKETAEKEETQKPRCGIIMPISAMDTYAAEHWADIKNILLDVIEAAGFTGSLVSDSEETSVIQKTIVQNVYNNDIVICDISGKNANVMFELGMRLAFDKATIVIKDFDTGFSFDTSPIEHLLYPRELRFQAIIEFKEKLKAKILATYEKSKTDLNYSTFLKSFGEFKIAHLESKEVSADEFIINELKDMKRAIARLSENKTDEFDKRRSKYQELDRDIYGFDILKIPKDRIELIKYEGLEDIGIPVIDYKIMQFGSDYIIRIRFKEGINLTEAHRLSEVVSANYSSREIRYLRLEN